MFSGEEGSEADNIEILGGDVGHSGGKAELWRFFRTSRSFWSGSGSWRSIGAPRGENSASAGANLLEAPEVEGIVRIGGVEEGEFGVVLFFLADAFLDAVSWGIDQRDIRDTKNSRSKTCPLRAT